MSLKNHTLVNFPDTNGSFYFLWPIWSIWKHRTEILISKVPLPNSLTSITLLNRNARFYSFIPLLLSFQGDSNTLQKKTRGNCAFPSTPRERETKRENRKEKPSGLAWQWGKRIAVKQSWYTKESHCSHQILVTSELKGWEETGEPYYWEGETGGNYSHEKLVTHQPHGRNSKCLNCVIAPPSLVLVTFYYFLTFILLF